MMRTNMACMVCMTCKLLFLKMKTTLNATSSKISKVLTITVHLNSLHSAIKIPS